MALIANKKPLLIAVEYAGVISSLVAPVVAAVNFLLAGGVYVELIVRDLHDKRHETPLKLMQHIAGLVTPLAGHEITYDYPPEVIDGGENIIKVTLVHSGTNRTPDPDIEGDRKAHENLRVG